MPWLDGTGPLGQGPMTGRCRGFCMLKTSERNPNEIKGFAGIDGKPIGRVTKSKQDLAKEVIEMPVGDRTAPASFGPMTTRAAGLRAGHPVPGYMNPVDRITGFFVPAVAAFAPCYAPSLPGYGIALVAPYISWPDPRLHIGFGLGLARGRGWGRSRGRFNHRWFGHRWYWW